MRSRVISALLGLIVLACGIVVALDQQGVFGSHPVPWPTTGRNPTPAPSNPGTNADSASPAPDTAPAPDATPSEPVPEPTVPEVPPVAPEPAAPEPAVPESAPPVTEPPVDSGINAPPSSESNPWDLKPTSPASEPSTPEPDTEPASPEPAAPSTPSSNDPNYGDLK